MPSPTHAKASKQSGTRRSRTSGRKPTQVARKPFGMFFRIDRAGSDQVHEAIDTLKRGLAYACYTNLKNVTGLSRAKLSEVLGIPERTLARRKRDGRLNPDESERLVRVVRVYELAVDLHEGDADAARTWLSSPKRALAGKTPYEMLDTEIGAREVENLVGRLEHGVFS